MISHLRITLLVDHQASRPDLETEHGLSFLVEADDEVLLFDAGASETAFRNAERLGSPWRRITRIVISHGHWDHTGGLGPFLRALPKAQVYLHPRSMSPKFSLHPGQSHRLLSMPDEVQGLLQARMAQLHWSTAAMGLGEGLGLTGPIPRHHLEEMTSGPFCLDAEGRSPDPLEDDQALWFCLPQGLVVLLGCAHAGVANSLDHIRALTNGAPILAVMGGLHLASASAERVQATVQTLRESGVQQVAPVHCTGGPASVLIQETFGNLGKSLRVGESLEFRSSQGLRGDQREPLG